MPKHEVYPVPEAVKSRTVDGEKLCPQNSTILTLQGRWRLWYPAFYRTDIRAYGDANTLALRELASSVQLMTAFQADAVCDFGPAGLLRERRIPKRAKHATLLRRTQHPRALLEAGGRCGSRFATAVCV